MSEPAESTEGFWNGPFSYPISRIMDDWSDAEPGPWDAWAQLQEGVIQ